MSPEQPLHTDYRRLRDRLAGFTEIARRRLLDLPLALTLYAKYIIMDELTLAQRSLSTHPMYTELNSLPAVRIFMRYHAFAVWDFMSLLKSLQRHITCVEIPWRPSPYPAELIRAINEIVLGEESDVDQDGNASSHFQLYLRAMREVQADVSDVVRFVETQNFDDLPGPIADFVNHHLELARTGALHEVAASFFFGREKLIPEMFQSIVKVLRDNQIAAPTLIYYLDRHIEVDGDSHGPLAAKCLEILCHNDNERREAVAAGRRSLELRNALWDFVASAIVNDDQVNTFNSARTV
jgi:hypothetical protein